MKYLPRYGIVFMAIMLTEDYWAALLDVTSMVAILWCKLLVGVVAMFGVSIIAGELD